MVDDAPESTIRVMPTIACILLSLSWPHVFHAGTSHVMLDESLVVLDDGEELAMALFCMNLI